MRLQRLELIRYGKFSGQTLNFPPAAAGSPDFHFILGPNEAGKSTVRRAVRELLFGMPLRSDMGFVHPLSELRLGGELQASDGGSPPLSFQRARGRKPLRDVQDLPLPDEVLGSFLGNTSENLFVRMFGLDWSGLLAGGQSILDAADDVGQLLFQSAAGLTGLGRLLDALEGEAKQLYSPRKSADKAFYRALEQHESAQQRWKQATVRAGAWTAASTRQDLAQAALTQAEQRYRTLAAQRQRLERIRRVAPRLAQYQRLSDELLALGELPRLPVDAAQQLADAEVRQASLLAMHQLQAERLHKQQQALTELHASQQAARPFLDDAQAIEALAQQALACSRHPQDLLKREDEVLALLRQAVAAAASLSWPTDEAALRQIVPPPPALKQVRTLLQELAALQQARQSAQAEMLRAEQALTRWSQPDDPRRPSIEVAPTEPAVNQAEAASEQVLAEAAERDLAVAIQQAEPCRFSGQRLQNHHQTWQTAYATWQTAWAAMRAIGPWQFAPQALAGLNLPSDEHLNALKAERAGLLAQVSARQAQAEQAQEAARMAELAWQQFQASHEIVTFAQVLQARAHRDGLWLQLSQQASGGAELATSSAPRQQLTTALTEAIQQADLQVDRHLANAAQAAELQQLQLQSERDAAHAQVRQALAREARALLDQADRHWQAIAEAAGLPGLALLDASSWLAQRQLAVSAQQQMEAVKAMWSGEIQALKAACRALEAALTSCGWLTTMPATAPADLSSSTDAGAKEHLNSTTTQRAAESVAASALALAARLTGLLQQAQSLVQARTVARAQAEAAQRERAEQAAQARQTLAELQVQAQARALAWEDWQARWTKALTAAGLNSSSLSPETAESAVEQAEQVRQWLAEAEALRQQRILPMQRDLTALRDATAFLWPRLNEAVAAPAETPARMTLGPADVGSAYEGLADSAWPTHPAAQGRAPASQVLNGLSGRELLPHVQSLSDAELMQTANRWLNRLGWARQRQAETERLQQELANAQAELDQTQAALQTNQAVLTGLCQLAGCDDTTSLRHCISACERQRQLQDQAQKHLSEALEAGDGLSLESLSAEAAVVSPEQLRPDIEALDQQLANALDQQTRLANEFNEARIALEQVQGGAQAAQAEGERLEALAAMTETAERYVEVASASALLRWAVDRYRERQQGPLLQRASQLFKQLTLGSFERLSLDHENQPPRLLCLRPGGERVALGGLSEGSRDQLFLALRLAALELHIRHDRPLPFIADDLFINFDDARAIAGLQALAQLARHTQVIFLTHHDHLLDLARQAVGANVAVQVMAVG